MLNTIEKLCAFMAISGREGSIAAYIKSQIAPHVDKVEIDTLGNVIAYKKGSKSGGQTAMYMAHMDEVGFIVTSITQEGFVKFAPVGGIDPQAVIGSRVQVGDEGLLGVIGHKPIHLLTGGERKAKASFEELYIDLGFSSKEQGETKIQLGDMVCFPQNFQPLGSQKLCAKALDDRMGCAMLLHLAKETPLLDTTFVFSVQEEIGCVGANTATFQIQPDFAIVVETTTAADNLGVSGPDRVCVLGEGAVISYMDKGTMYDRNLYQYTTAKAEEMGIPHQTKTGIYGGNDGSAIHKSGKGVKTIAVSVPCRNLHTASVVADKRDIQSTYDLLLALLQSPFCEV